MNPTAAAASPDPRAAIGRARADLRLAASKAELEGDPLRPVLEAFGASLGAMGELLDHAEASRQPMDAKERADMTRQLVAACRADFVRQAVGQSRRLAVLSGFGAAVLLLGAWAAATCGEDPRKRRKCGKPRG